MECSYILVILTSHGLLEARETSSIKHFQLSWGNSLSHPPTPRRQALDLDHHMLKERGLHLGTFRTLVPLSVSQTSVRNKPRPAFSLLPRAHCTL